MELNIPIRASNGSGRDGVKYGSANADFGVDDTPYSPEVSHLQDADRLVCAVDFGTTFSGVAHVYSVNPDDVDIIKTWPGGNGITSDKVPTELSYEPLPPSASRRASSHSLAQHEATNGDDPSKNLRWGFQVSPHEQRIRCIKLFLDRNQKLPPFVSPLETASQLKQCGRNVMQAVSDYLKRVYEHTLDSLNRRYGEAFVSQTAIDFILTTPAVWSDTAKNATLIAAERAGMGSRHTLRLISEPEAAALYALKTMQPSFIRVGNNFVVCDAGGGTVDLIAYRIVQISPLRIEESAVGTGGLCGSAFLNYRFEDHVRKRFGMERFNNMRNKKPKTWNMALRNFEEFVKRNFNDSDTQDEINIPFPGLPDDEDIGLDSGFLIMTPDQLRDIFEPVISQVVDLVAGQVDNIRENNEVVSGIILVGGFGQSNYLYNRLKSHFSNKAVPPPPYSERPTHKLTMDADDSIEVLQPLHAWTAVVRGAVARGLESISVGDNVVTTRRARFHYGTSYATVFDPAKHPISDRYYSPLWERFMVSDRVQWHVQKGQPLETGHAVSFHYTRNFRPGQTLVVQDDLIACSEEEAPDAFGPTLISVCTLTTDLNAVPQSLFTRLTTTKGVEFDNLDFTLDMIIESAGLAFELRVDGIRYGRVDAEFH